MVFRGSFGVLTQDLMPSAGFQEYTATAVVQQVTGDPRPAFYLSQGPPNRNFIINPDGTSQFLGTNYSGRGATYIDPNLRMPYVMNWSGERPDPDGSDVADRVAVPGLVGRAVSTRTAPNINQLAKSYYDFH